MMESEGKIEVLLSLPWKVSSLIHYVVQSVWPPPTLRRGSGIKCKVGPILPLDFRSD